MGGVRGIVFRWVERWARAVAVSGAWKSIR
jgi:hypothetical protein